RRRRRQHAALAVEILRLARGTPAAIVEELRLLPLGELLDVLDVERAVEAELRIQAPEPVRLRGERDVVPGGEVLELDPVGPLGREAASEPRRLELLPGLPDLGPGP